MITVTVVENPFAPHIKNIYEFEHNPYFAVDGYYTVMELEEGVELQYALNGKLVSNPSMVVPQDGCHIAVVPVVKGGVGNFFKSILMVGVMIAAAAVSAGAAAAGANAFWAAMAGVATSVVGGLLVNMIFPTKPLSMGSLNYTYNQEPQSYGWDLPAPAQAEGHICGETYGTAIPQPQILGQHVTTKNGKQYLSVLFSGGMGQIDEIKNIRIGYTDIGYYDNVEIDTKLGTNDQTPVKFFDYTYSDQSVNVSLSRETPVTQTTTAKNATGLEITFFNPGGIYAVNDDGNLVTANAQFEILYRMKGSKNWNIWHTNYVLSGATTAEKYTTISLSNLPEGQYETRIRVLSGCTSGARECTLTRWSTYTAVIPGKYCRAGKVLVALRIMASNQLSGAMPNINWTQTRSTVYVYDWNKGGYVAKEATNPIWAAYDILHQCRKLKNINSGKDEYVVEGVPAKRFMTFWDRWEEAAAYADELIPNPDGELEKRFTFNAFFDSGMKRITAAQKAASVGHAVILSRGSDFSVVVDKPAEICQIFGEGRTIQGSFNGYFSNADERAKTVEVTFNPADNDFLNTQFLVRAPNWNKEDSMATDSSGEVSLFGVSRKSQAYREAIFQLAHNERQIQFAELQADIDALVCEYGDVVGVAHTVAQIGTASGRIVSADRESVTLDCEVPVLSKYAYQIMIQRSSDDSLLKKDVVVAADGAYTTFRFCEPLTDEEAIPQQHDVYCFGEQEKTVKPFRVIGITRSGDLKVTLKLAEYDEALYALDTDYADYPLIDYTPKSTAKPVDDLILTEQTYTQRDGTLTSEIVATWKIFAGQTLVEYDVLLSEDGETFERYARTDEPRCVIRGAKTGRTYYVKITTVYDIVKLPGKTERIYITGKDFPPPDLEEFTVVQSGEKMVAVIEPLKAPDIDYYELRQGSSWEKSKLIGTFSGSKYEFPATENGTLTFFCKPIDNSGQYSEKAASSIVNVIGLPPKNVFYEQTFSEDWEVRGMYKDSRGYWTLRHKKRLGDYAKFADIFQDDNPYVDDAEILLPIIDLGENIVDESCFWKDSHGKLHLKSTKTLADFEKFTDIFQTKLEYVKVRYMNSTFASILIDGYAAGAGRYIAEYRTSIDGEDWSDWIPETVTQFAGRYIQVRVRAESLDGKGTVYIRRISISIDVPDVEEIIENIKLSADTTTHIEFAHTFKEVKSIAAYTQDLAGKQCTCYIEKSDAHSADVAVLDAAGNQITGLLQKIIIRGY